MFSFFVYLATLGGVGFYVWPQTGLVYSLLALAAALGALKWPLLPANRQERLPLKPLTTLAVALLAWPWWQTLLTVETVEAVRGPWAVASQSAVWGLGLAGALAVALKRPRLTALLWGAGGLLAASVFPLGFGFDPFIHEATLQHLLTYGDLSPKQPYYAAFYGLAQSLLHLTNWPLHDLLRFFVPATFVVGSWWLIKRLPSDQRLPWVLASLFFPLAGVIQSTPYGLGLVGLFLLVGLRITDVPKKSLWWLAAAICLTHPLPGILALAGTLSTYKNKVVHVMYISLALLGVPLLFSLQALLNGQLVGWTWQTPNWNELLPGSTNVAYRALDDLLFLIGANGWWLGLILAALGSYLLWKNKQPLTWSWLVGGTLTSSVLLAGGFVFYGLPDYEKLDYAKRLLDLAIILALPLITVSWQKLLERLPTFKSRLPLAGLAGLLLAALVIGAYPRHDAYARYGGISVSQNDYLALEKLEDLAAGQSYAVLANQSLSAAALQTFGFVKRYVGPQGDVYFYPIPTGSPLGLLTTDILQRQPTAAKIHQAWEITQTERLFLVIHDYWSDSTKLKAQAASLSFQSYDLAPGITAYEFAPDASQP